MNADHDVNAAEAAGSQARNRTLGDMAAYFGFLDGMREGGTVNMFAASPWLRAQFSLARSEAHRILSLWMKTLDKDRSAFERARTALALSEGGTPQTPTAGASNGTE